VLLVENDEIFRKSRAALRIARQLDGALPVVYYLFFWVPSFIADAAYDYIGRHRYRWFGRKDECWVPETDLRGRFIDQ
jgi:predicted DCC family thiol-disulfide oxidoreductase YuxK